MSFIDFIIKYSLKNKATSSTKNHQIFSSLALNNVGIYLRDGPFTTDVGIVNLYPTKGTNWDAYIVQNYFDSYGCSPPQKPSRIIIERHGHCLCSEYI